MAFSSLNKKRSADVSSLDERVESNCYTIYRDGTIFSNKSKKNLTVFLRNQYLAVRCSGRTLSLHRLLALAFLNNEDLKRNKVVDHLDNNKLNNRLDNLRWSSQSENIKRSHKWRAKGKYEPLTDSQKRILLDVQRKHPEVKNHEDLNRLMNL
jgi:hypothetical protein